MAEIPRGLIGLEAKMPLQLFCAHALLRLSHECDREKPFMQRQMRIVKQGARGCGELLLTGWLKALVELANILLFAAGSNAGNLIGAADQTPDTFRPAPGF